MSSALWGAAFAIGATLELRGADSAIKFKASGASLSATCPDTASASLLYIYPREFSFMMAYPEAEVITAVLLGVPTTCSASSLAMPCASIAATGRPAGVRQAQHKLNPSTWTHCCTIQNPLAMPPVSCSSTANGSAITAHP